MKATNPFSFPEIPDEYMFTSSHCTQTTFDPSILQQQDVRLVTTNDVEHSRCSIAKILLGQPHAASGTL